MIALRCGVPRRKLPEIGETFTTPRSKRVFTCIAHVDHVRKDGFTVIVPLWRINCVKCHDPMDRARYRPKMVTCRTCLDGYSPDTATAKRRRFHDEAWKLRGKPNANVSPDASELRKQSEAPITSPSSKPRMRKFVPPPPASDQTVRAPSSGVFRD